MESELKASKPKKRNIIVCAVAGVALVIGGLQSISYVSSADAREEYECTMAMANTEYVQGNYIIALDLFRQAENNYNASYSTSSYKREAHSQAIHTSDKIIQIWEEDVRPLMRSGRVVRAKLLTLDLPANLVLEGYSERAFNSLSGQIDAELTARSAAMINELLNDIYTNQGKLSESKKAELNELIRVIPDNYWLNFISDKANEE